MFRFAVPRLKGGNFETRAILSIHDLKGRLVSKVERIAEPGYHNLLWNGKDRNSRNAASGMYISRLQIISANGKELFSRTGKVTLIK